MTDDETKSWLSDEERVGFEHALQDCRPGDADTCRSLAETRKHYGDAVSRLKYAEVSGCADLCADDHRRFVATMPRPR